MLIDACQLGPGHSSFLQQAAYLSGGTYLKPARPQALVQYLNVRLRGRVACVARLADTRAAGLHTGRGLHAHCT